MATPAQAPSPELVFNTLNAYQRSAALRAAIELDVFRAIGEGYDTAASIASRCSASERGIRILCDYLTVIELLRKEDGRYRHSATSAVFLDPQSPASIADTARFLSNPAMYEPYLHLADVVRSGRTTLAGEGSVEPDNPVWVEFAHSMAPMMAPMAAPLGGLALGGLEGPVEVLDIAAGHGLFGIEVAKQNSEARVTAVDWAAVLDVARANAVKAGVGDRFYLKPGSAFDVEYGGPYDLVLLTNFLHHFDRATCVSLLKKVHAATKPGGRAATLEFVPNEDRVTPPTAAGFSLMMLGTTVAGDVYTFRELESMYEEAGFVNVTGHPLPRSPHTVVIGEVVR